MSTCCGYACVTSSNVGIVEKFGSYDDVIPPGCSWIGCCGADLRGEVSLRTRLLRVHTKSATQDKVIVTFTTVVMFHVIPSECHTAFYALSSLNQISSYVDDSVRGEIARLNFEDVFTAKDRISQDVRQLVHPELASRGFEVDDILIETIDVPREIREAAERKLENKYIRMANQYRAEANKIAVTKRAEAEADVKRLQGVGMANQQAGVSGGFGDLITAWEGGDQSSKIIAMMMMQQYFDSMTSLAANSGNHTAFFPGLSMSQNVME